LNSKGIEEVKSTLTTEFHEVFRDELQNNGYELTDEAGDDVMIVRTALDETRENPAG
jgi:hypothetical protein